MSSLQKAVDLTELDVQIVVANFKPYAHLLQIDSFGVLAVLLGLLGTLVIVLAPINYTRHWRLGVRRNLHQVQSGLFSGLQGLRTAQNPQLPAVIANNPQAGGSDLLVDPGRFGYNSDSM